MSTIVNEERLMKIILAPRVSEKSTFVGQFGQYVFSVIADANKIEVKRAIELLFKVKVDSVNILNPKSKIKRTGRVEGRKKAYKKAYVILADGERINLGNA
jgi:large subunit ribosomal protein L23